MTEEEAFYRALTTWIVALTAAMCPLILSIKNWFDAKALAVKTHDLRSRLDDMVRRQGELDKERAELRALAEQVKAALNGNGHG